MSTLRGGGGSRLVRRSASSGESFKSPRAWAFTLLGLEAYRASFPQDACAIQLQHLLAGKLSSILSAAETQDWVWFEDELAYDNARLSQALIVTGASAGAPPTPQLDCDRSAG